LGQCKWRVTETALNQDQFAECGIGESGRALLAAAVASNFVLRDFEFGDGVLDAELRCWFRVPHVRFLVRTRAMCQAGRARAAGARGDVAVWLIDRAPLWVVVRVCALLRDADD
jgi:hypothetical protein